MTDEFDDVLPLDERFTVLRVATQVACVGAIFGAVEGLVLASWVKLLLTPGERVQMALAAVLADGLVALAFGLIGGGLARVLPRQILRWRRDRIGFSVAFALFSAFFLVPMGMDLYRRGDAPVHALGMAGLVCSLGFFAWFNAGYWYRREAIGMAPRIGWRLPALVVALSLALGAAFVQPKVRRIDSAPPGSPNIVLITVDTLRRDHVGAFGSGAKTPVMDRLAAEGAAFDNAVTPLPETAPSHASMMTGLHPAEHEIVQNGRTLSSGRVTVAEQLSAIGWRTGAFVSAFAVDSSTGLDQGFEVYDDDFLPFFRGLSEFRTGNLALRLLMRLGDPADWPSLLERAAPDTIERALAFTDRVVESQPVFLWVHLFEPHSPYDSHPDAEGEIPPGLDHRPILAQEPGYTYTDDERALLKRQYRDEVEYVDSQIGLLLDGLRARHRLDNASIVVVADHGEALGEHGVDFTHHGLYDEVVRVPLILWQSTPAVWPSGAHNGVQVSVQDVANTLLEQSGAPLLEQTASLPLGYRLTHAEVRPQPILLMGRSNDAWLYGVRSPGGVKYIKCGAGEELFDLNDDPEETMNLASDQPGAVANGRANIEMLLQHVDRDAQLEHGTEDLLEALGYVEPTVSGAEPSADPDSNPGCGGSLASVIAAP